MSTIAIGRVGHGPPPFGCMRSAPPKDGPAPRKKPDVFAIASRRSELAFALALALVACRGPEPAGPVPGASDLFSSLVSTATATRSLRTEGRVTYWGDGERIRLKTIVLAQRPDRFRVETLTPFQEPIDVVASDGASLWWLSREALKVGPATASRLGEVLPLRLAPNQVVDVLIGGVPTAGHWAPRSVEAVDAELLRLRLVDPGGREASLWVERDAPRVRRIELPARLQEPAIEVELSDHDGLVARRIDLRVPDRDLEVQIRLQSPEYGVPLADALFRVDPPPGRGATPW